MVVKRKNPLIYSAKMSLACDFSIKFYDSSYDDDFNIFTMEWSSFHSFRKTLGFYQETILMRKSIKWRTETPAFFPFSKHLCHEINFMEDCFMTDKMGAFFIRILWQPLRGEFLFVWNGKHWHPKHSLHSTMATQLSFVLLKTFPIPLLLAGFVSLCHAEGNAMNFHKHSLHCASAGAAGMKSHECMFCCNLDDWDADDERDFNLFQCCTNDFRKISLNHPKYSWQRVKFVGREPLRCGDIVIVINLWYFIVWLILTSIS